MSAGDADWLELLARAVQFPDPVNFPADWEDAERRLSTRLPTDYKRLVEHFGGGEFDGYMGLLIPMEGSPIDVVGASENLNAGLAANPHWRRLFEPFPVYPDPDGLLRWAHCGYGQRYYWLTESEDPDEWPIVARPRGPEYYRFDGSTSKFLYLLLTEQLQIDFVPERETEGPLTFSP